MEEVENSSSMTAQDLEDDCYLGDRRRESWPSYQILSVSRAVLGFRAETRATSWKMKRREGYHARLDVCK